MELGFREAGGDRLERAISIDTVGVLFFDLTGRIQDANAAMERMTGYTRDELRAIDHWSTLTPPEFHGVTAAAARDLAATGRTTPYEKPFIRKDGSRWWGVFAPTRIAGSGPDSACVEFVIDITANKRREAHATFLAAMADDFGRLSSADEIMEVIGERIGGYLDLTTCLFVSVDEAKGQVTAEHAWNREGIPSLRATYRLDEYTTEEFARLSRAGETVIVEDTAGDPRTDSTRYAQLGVRAFMTVPFHHERVWRWYLAVTDNRPRPWRPDEIELFEEVAARVFPRIERARAETALRDSEAKYRSLFESIDEGFCIIEVLFDGEGRPNDYRFLEVNPAFERLTGLHDTVGRTIRELTPEHEAQWFEMYGQVALTGLPARFEQSARALGREYDVFALRVGSPGDHRVAVVFRDVTDRKVIEEERVAQLERERHGREAAEAFLAVMSHELRTPVTSIMGIAELLARNPARSDLGDLVTDMREEAERLTRIIDDLLVLSSVERGLIQLSPEPVLLHHLAAEIVTGVQRRFPRVTIESQMPASLPLVTGDVTALRQILYNLLTNAAKYAGDDGPVTLTAEVRDETVVVSILDEGPGLGDEPDQLFTLFYRSPHTAKLASGTGIGLYVARELADAMGARIEAATRETGGAAFTLVLDVAERDDD